MGHRQRKQRFLDQLLHQTNRMAPAYMGRANFHIGRAPVFYQFLGNQIESLTPFSTLPSYLSWLFTWFPSFCPFLSLLVPSPLFLPFLLSSFPTSLFCFCLLFLLFYSSHLPSFSFINFHIICLFLLLLLYTSSFTPSFLFPSPSPSTSSLLSSLHAS